MNAPSNCKREVDSAAATMSDSESASMVSEEEMQEEDKVHKPLPRGGITSEQLSEMKEEVDFEKWVTENLSYDPSAGGKKGGKEGDEKEDNEGDHKVYVPLRVVERMKEFFGKGTIPKEAKKLIRMRNQRKRMKSSKDLPIGITPEEFRSLRKSIIFHHFYTAMQDYLHVGHAGLDTGATNAELLMRVAGAGAGAVAGYTAADAFFNRKKGHGHRK